MRSPLSRRAFAALAAASAVPWLSSASRGWIAEARGAPPTKRRLITLVVGNGMPEVHYRPTRRSATDFDLPAAYAPLNPHKGSLVLIEPLYNPHDKNLHGNGWATLSMVPSPDTKAALTPQITARPGGISIDRLIAQRLGASDPISSLNLAHYEYIGKLAGAHVSADGLGKPYPSEWNAVRAFDSLFGMGMAAADADATRARRDKSVLDFVKEDIRRVSSNLAAPEQARLEQYTTSLRALETKLVAPRGSCTAPTRPPASLGTLPAVTRRISAAEVKAFLDLTVAALACNLTRVASVSLHGGSTDAHDSFPDLGFAPDDDWHDLHHAFAASEAKLLKIETWLSSQVAYLRDQLALVKDGDGTLADSTLVLWVNSSGGSHHNGHDSHPVMLLGNLRGALRTGQSLRFPKMQHSMADAFVTVANAMGVPITTFGTPEHCTGPIAGLLA